ncbi:DUF1127 domain-containing protein [Phyllobacterium endophyticum]|uniref:DUF1127 domain-containing protein n=1 Tax=Phyllobacterium endophyticum TaxID=1149773 RepID=UPI001FEF584D|nr:DUF1127 domain-containing protein [Phyllobacterium endophyticum]
MGTIDTINVKCPAEGRERGAGKARLSRTICAAFMWFGKAMLKRRTRMHLSELSNDLLDDIGVDPSAARREVKRFFWD